MGITCRAMLCIFSCFATFECLLHSSGGDYSTALMEHFGAQLLQWPILQGELCTPNYWLVICSWLQCVTRGFKWFQPLQMVYYG